MKPALDPSASISFTVRSFTILNLQHIARVQVQTQVANEACSTCASSQKHQHDTPEEGAEEEEDTVHLWFPVRSKSCNVSRRKNQQWVCDEPGQLCAKSAVYKDLQVTKINDLNSNTGLVTTPISALHIQRPTVRSVFEINLPIKLVVDHKSRDALLM